jgi:hypothetical protein
MARYFIVSFIQLLGGPVAKARLVNDPKRRY